MQMIQLGNVLANALKQQIRLALISQTFVYKIVQFYMKGMLIIQQDFVL